MESHIQCTIFPTSGRFGRWPEGKLWLCGGFKSVGSSVCCKHEHVQQGNRFHGDLKRSKRSPFFKARTSGPLTYDSWPCIFLRVLCIRIWKNSCGEFQVPSFHLQLPWKWSVELSFFECFLKLAFENPLLFGIDGFGSNSHSKFSTGDPADLLLVCFNLKSMLLIFIAYLPSSWVFLAKWCGISAYIQPLIVFPSFLKVSWSVPGLCFLPLLEDWMMMFLILFHFAELHVLLMQRACATERVILYMI